MAFFPRNVYGPDPSFTPLFRLLNDFDSYSREVQGEDASPQGGRHTHQVRSFNPKFDVRETETAYELHGELPGIDREAVHIEFTEPQTIVVRGRIERSYTSGTPPAGLVEDGNNNNGRITESGENSHKARVEDEAAEQAKEEGKKAGPSETQVTARHKNNNHNNKSKGPAEKFWVSERSIGEFSRTFSFPTPVDQDNVSANLDNGVLSVVVPKAKKQQTRRIAIN